MKTAISTFSGGPLDGTTRARGRGRPPMYLDADGLTVPSKRRDTMVARLRFGESISLYTFIGTDLLANAARYRWETRS